jgi:general secretion pathway protein G
MQASLERLRQRREDDQEGGFTLIELLIVIVILAILAAIVVFAVQNLTKQSATAACQSDFKTVETATETFKAQLGDYPNTADEGTGNTYPNGATLAAATSPGTGEADPGVLDLMGTATIGTTTTFGPWLKDYPYNPSHYSLTVSENGKGTISVLGPTGTVLGTDTNACAAVG